MPDLVDSRGTSTTNKDKANALLRQFQSVWSHVSGVYLPQFCHRCTEPSHLIDVDQVEHLLSGINIKKAAGSDKLPSIVLKYCSAVLAPPVAVLYNRSIKESVVPDLWKRAVITPVPKKGDLRKPENWRPISVLSVLAKLLEKHMATLLKPYIVPKLHKSQYGFITGRGTEDALVNVEHAMKLRMSPHGTRKGTVCAISFDISKAFDCVPFDKLVHCLRTRYNLPGCLLSWVSDYLFARKYSVRVGSELSSLSTVKAGVVQGSVLGPLLFVAYFDEICGDLPPEAAFAKYADDLLVLHPMNSPHDEHNVHALAKNIIEASAKKGLTMNAAKCQYGIFSESSQPFEPANGLVINGKEAKRNDNLQYLGVMFDKRVNWADNTQVRVQKAKRMLGALKNCFGKFFSRKQFLNIVTAKILPIALYGMTVTYPRLLGPQKCLERLLEHCCRSVTRDYTTATDDLLFQLGQPSVKMLTRQRQIILARSYIRKWRYIPANTITPLKQDNRLRQRYNDQSYQTACQTHLRTANSSLEMMLDLWNQVPNRWLWLSKAKFKEALLLHNFPLDN